MSAPLHSTTDPYLASFLTSQRAVLASCRRISPKKVLFSFVADRRLHDLLRQYWSGVPVMIVPALLMDALRSLKSRSLTRP